MDIDICVCTFRRGSLRETLASIAIQTIARSSKLRVIVADNDEAPSARALVEACGEALGLNITYVHAPARNISTARNACLDTATSDLIAFIDDDEIAEPDWLSQLVSALDEAEADVAFGPVRAVYPATAPEWIRRGDFHSMDVVQKAGGVVQTGYTSNCLIRRSAIAGERFDLSLGRSGGEDTEFFHRLFRMGRKLVSAPDAIVREPVAEHRQNLRWLVERSFRAGQTHGRLLQASDVPILKALPLTVGKGVYCFGTALLQIWSPRRSRAALIRGALHAGATARLLGADDLQIYGKAS